MPTLRARLVRLLLRHTMGRRFRKGVLPVDECRKLDALVARNQRPPRGTTVEPVTVGDRPAEWISGPGATPGAAILYLHGGAFVMGSPATHRELAARVSAAGGAPVLSPDFRLAPEFPFPAALEDATRAYRFLLDQGLSPERVVIGGDSSGGGLALQALLSLKEQSTPLPHAAFLLSPVTDWVEPCGDLPPERCALDPLVTPEQCRHTATLYAGDRAGDPLLQPTKMDLRGLPPLWIQAGDHEILLGDAQRLADRATRAGVDVHFKVWPGMWHVFQGAARYVPEARRSLEELSAFLREALKVRDTGAIVSPR